MDKDISFLLKLYRADLTPEEKKVAQLIIAEKNLRKIEAELKIVRSVEIDGMAILMDSLNDKLKRNI